MRLKNLAGMGWGVFRSRAMRLRLPLNVMLSLTNRCTSQCVYCNIPQRSHQELTTREILALIDQLRQAGTERLGLWGGEPLVRDDIGTIVDHAKGRGLFVSIDSNGHCIEDKLPYLKNLDHFILALDGPEPMHDCHRGPGSFHKAMRAASLLQGKMPVWTITVLTKHNLDGIDFILETARRFGFFATFQVLHHNDVLGRTAENLLPSGESYRAAVGKLIRMKKKGAPIASSFLYLEHLLRWPDFSRPTLDFPVDGLRCQAGRLFCNVDTDGSVYPCSLLVGKMHALNYLDAGFKKAFDGLRDAPCKACDASCFTEYNYLFSANVPTVIEWVKAIYGSRRCMRCR